MTTMPQTTPLPDRAILALGGRDARAFLQGMVTQNITRLSPSCSQYTLHLTGQGRFLFDFFIIEHNGTLLLDCAKDRLMPLARALHAYLLREDVVFDDASADWQIYASWGATDAHTPGTTTRTGSIITVTDPRLGALGTRLYAPIGTSVTTSATPETYAARRIALGVPDGFYDAQPGQTLPGELGLEYLNAVDFAKGCYVGQELTARLHFRTPPKKRLMQVTLEGAPPAPFTPILLGTREVGHTCSVTREGEGLAILRLSEVEKAAHDGTPLTAAGAPLHVQGLPAYTQA